MLLMRTERKWEKLVWSTEQTVLSFQRLAPSAFVFFFFLDPLVFELLLLLLVLLLLLLVLFQEEQT